LSDVLFVGAMYAFLVCFLWVCKRLGIFLKSPCTSYSLGRTPKDGRYILYHDACSRGHLIPNLATLLFGARGYSTTYKIVLIEHSPLVLFVSTYAVALSRHVLSSMVDKRLLFMFVFYGGIGSAMGPWRSPKPFIIWIATVVIPASTKLQPSWDITGVLGFLKERIEGDFFGWAAVILFGSFVICGQTCVC